MRRWPNVRIVVAFRAARTQLARYVSGSIAVHGALLAVILIVPATHHRAAPIEDAMVVALSGPIAAPSAPPGVATSTPAVKPQPAPPPPPKEAHTVREVPISKPKEKPVKPKKELAKSPDDAKPAPPAETKSDPPQGNSAGVPGASGAAVTATVGGGDSSLGWYGAAVKAALESAWVKPYLEDAAGISSVVIAFDIARDGTTKNIRIQTGSGIPSLDRSAQRAVIEASPLPPVPPTWTDATIPVTMRFDLSPETR